MPDTGFSIEQLQACVEKHLDGTGGNMRFVRIPTGKFNTSYYVDSGHARYVLRIAPSPETGLLFYERDMMKQEPGIHRLLREKTRIPVPEIVAADLSRDTIDRDFLIMSRLPGEALSNNGARDLHRTLAQVGEYLAQAHGQTASRYGYLGEHHPMDPQSAWVDAFAVMWRKMIDDIRAAGQYTDREGDHLLSLFDTYRGLFDRPVPSSLLHMDVWGQNILVDPHGNVTGLVDWDRALWGDPEIEFAVLDYCGISEPAFWEGYGTPRDTSKEARIRNVFYLLYEIQKYIVIRLLRSGDRAAAAAYKRQVMSIASRVRSF